jgi:hypothetical protein
MQIRPPPSPSASALKNKIVLLNSNAASLQSFVPRFTQRFPGFSVITHIPMFHLDGLAVLASFASKQATFLVICKPEAWSNEIRRARELAGSNGVDVYEIFLSQDNIFMHAMSRDMGDQLLLFSEDKMRQYEFQSLKSRIQHELVNSM